jgi:hypothetical protein
MLNFISALFYFFILNCHENVNNDKDNKNYNKNIQTK